MALPALTAKRTPFPGCEVPPLFPLPSGSSALSYRSVRPVGKTRKKSTQKCDFSKASVNRAMTHQHGNHDSVQTETWFSKAESSGKVMIQPFTATNDSNFLDSAFRYQLFPTAYGIIFILGLFANIYVLVVLRCLREAKAMGEIRIYMTNLTIADLLFVCALPFWIGYYSRQGTWIYKDFLCRLTGSLFFINTYCSILFLGAISVNRYWAVTRPLDAASSDHRRRGIAICVVIWLTTLSMAVPFLANPGTNQDRNVTRCFEGYQNGDDSSKRVVAAMHFAIIAMFFVVFALVVVCNLLIARALFSQSAPLSELKSGTVLSRKSNMTISLSRRPTGVKRRAVQMLMAVVGVFVLCFLPHHVVQGFWTLAVLQIQEGWGHVDWNGETMQALNDAHQVTLLLMGLNCILDPVVYCFATRKFRRYIMADLKRLAKGESCSHTVTSQISLDSRHQSQRLPDELIQPEQL